MSQDQLQSNPQETLQKEQAIKLSPEAIKDVLDKYDGFDELLSPLADNLDRFSPKNASKKKRFLDDEDTRTEKEEFRNRLLTYINFLGSPDANNHKQIRSGAQQKLDSNESLINKNLSTIMNEAKDLERTYRELDIYFKNVGAQKPKNLVLYNAHAETLVDPDSNLVYAAVEKRIQDESRAIDQKKAFSLLVIPNLWRSKSPKNLIERYSKLAGEARMSFLTDFADCDTLEEALKEKESKRWTGTIGPEIHHSKLIMFANHMVLRGKHNGVEEEGEMRGSPAMAVAGKMYAEKISQPIMGELNGSLTGGEGIAFRTVQDEVADLSDAGLNGLTHAYQKDMVYEACTAFDGAEYALKRYAVVRTFDYVNRVLRHYLGKVTGQALDRDRANLVRDTVQDFLDQLAEQKIITKGKVAYFDWNSRVPDRIDIDIQITPIWAVRTFVYALKAAKGSPATAELKE